MVCRPSRLSQTCDQLLFLDANGSSSLNARGLPLRVRDSSGSVSRLDHQYAYDKHGNLTSARPRPKRRNRRVFRPGPSPPKSFDAIP